MSKPSPVEVFDKAIQTVTQERGTVYGHPAEDFSRVALMARGIEDCPDPRIRHALYLILVKVARLVNTPSHVDSVVDIAGYARTIAMIQTADAALRERAADTEKDLLRSIKAELHAKQQAGAGHAEGCGKGPRHASPVHYVAGMPQ